MRENRLIDRVRHDGEPTWTPCNTPGERQGFRFQGVDSPAGLPYFSSCQVGGGIRGRLLSLQGTATDLVRVTSQLASPAFAGGRSLDETEDSASASPQGASRPAGS